MNIFVFVFVLNIAKVLSEIKITKLEENKIIKKQDWFPFLQVVCIYCCLYFSVIYMLPTLSFAIRTRAEALFCVFGRRAFYL